MAKTKSEAKQELILAISLCILAPRSDTSASDRVLAAIDAFEKACKLEVIEEIASLLVKLQG